MTSLFSNEDVGELSGIGEITVMPEHHAVGRIHIKGLRFSGTIMARSGIAHVPDADIALEIEHVLLIKDIAHEPRAFTHRDKTARGGHDPRSILTPMLEHR
jgi:hypothetical protein